MHSFFACVSAPFYPPDQEHQSYVHTQHLEDHLDSQNNDNDNDNDNDQQEHEMHVHLSCHSGYGVAVTAFSCLQDKVTTPHNTFINLEHTPPVPPPNSVFFS